MLCWQFEDQRVQKTNPFMPGKCSNIPLVCEVWKPKKKKKTLIMKWNTSAFLENRLFDSRLSKSALIGNKFKVDDEIYKQRMDYRHFKETYVYLKFEFFHHLSLHISHSLKKIEKFFFSLQQETIRFQTSRFNSFSLIVFYFLNSNSDSFCKSFGAK